MNSRRDAPQYVFLLALLALLPLPFGSNREWAWLTAASLSFALGAWTLTGLALQRQRYAPALSASATVLGWWGLWLAFGLLQLIPMPLTWLAALSPHHPVLNAGLGWTGWASLSVDPHASFLALVQGLFLFSLFFLTLALARTRRRVRWLAMTMLVAGFAQALYGSFMTLSGIEWGFFEVKEFGRGLATGTFINRNHFAGFLEICLALGIGLLLARVSHAKLEGLRAKLRHWVAVALGPKMRLRLCLAVMVVALVLSRSRMGNSAFFAALLVAGLLALVVMRPLPRPLLALILSLLLIDILIVGTWFGVEQVVERLQQTGSYDPVLGEYRDQDRLDVDQETLTAWRDYPWLGSGGGTFHTVFPAYRSAEVGAFFDHAHNDYLEFLLEYGVLGVIPLAAIFILSIVRAVLAQRRRRDPLMRAMGFSVTMVGVSYMLHSTVDFNLHIPSNAAYFTVCLALAWIALDLTRQRVAAGKQL